MSHRFYFPTLSTAQDTLELAGDQAHHAIQVMRFKVGDQITLFDGMGLEAIGEITETAKKSLQLNVFNRHQRPPLLATDITLAVALPKGERQKFLIEKLVEIGVAHFVPLVTERGVAAVNEKVIDRIEKQVVEASKQCERAWLMSVQQPMKFEDLAQWSPTSEPRHESEKPRSEAEDQTHGGESANEASEIRRFFGDPYEGVQAATAANGDERRVVIAIGPEGGFSETEIAEAKSLGFEGLRLGESILRIETAAIAAGIVFGLGRGGRG